MKVTWFVLAPLLLLAACSPASAPAPQAAEALPTAQLLPAEVASATATLPAPTETPTAEPQPAEFSQRPQYHIQATLNYDAHQLDVTQTVTYPNHSGENIEEISLVVEPQRFPDAFHLQEFKLNGRPVTGYTLNNGRLDLPLPESLAAGQALTLELRYRIQLPSRYGAFGFTSLQANFHNWYPFFPPYIPGEGWLIHSHSAVGEYLVYPTADFEVSISNPQPEITVAAPNLKTTDGDTRTYRLEAARSFMWSASPYWQVSGQMVDEVQVQVYYFTEHAAAGEHLLREVSKALQIYQELFGPYPFSTLSAVEFNSLDGMESDALYFISYGYFNSYDSETLEYDPKFQNYLTIIGVHEICHNWWYSQVGNDQALEPWLDETLSTYCELLYYQRTNSALTTWWWDFRVKQYEPAGWVDATVYDYYDSQSYINATYLQGVTMMRNLRASMGDQAFFAALREYAESGKGRIMSATDFWAVMEAHTDNDLIPLREKFFKPLEKEETEEN